MATAARTRKSKGRAKADAPKRPADWNEAVDRFAAHLEEQEKSAHTVKGYRDDLAFFAEWYRSEYEDLPELATIQAAELRAWKNHLVDRGSTPLIKFLTESNGTAHSLRRQKHAPQSVNRRLSALRSFLRWAEAHEWCNPVAVPKSARQEVGPPKWMTKKEQLALLRAVDRVGDIRDSALMRVFINCGLRIAEAASLTWGAIEISERKGALTVTGKGRKQRTVPLNVEVRHALQDLAMAADDTKDNTAVFIGQRGPLSANAIWRVIASYGRAAGLDITPHELRHTFCRRLAEVGTRIEVIAGLAGHESIETTRRYIEPGQEDYVGAVEKLAGGEN